MPTLSAVAKEKPKYIWDYNKFKRTTFNPFFFYQKFV